MAEIATKPYTCLKLKKMLDSCLQLNFRYQDVLQARYIPSTPRYATCSQNDRPIRHCNLKDRHLENMDCCVFSGMCYERCAYSVDHSQGNPGQGGRGVLADWRGRRKMPASKSVCFTNRLLLSLLAAERMKGGNESLHRRPDISIQEQRRLRFSPEP